MTLRSSSQLDDEWARSVSKRVAAGSRDALESLYAARFERLFRMIRSMTRRDDDFAIDCVQDAWLRVVRSLPALDSLDALDRWLARAAVSAALDRLRTDAARRRRELAHETSTTASDEPAIELLRSELRRLGERDRTILDLRFRGGLSLQELGAALGIGMKSAEMRLRRALARLRLRMTSDGSTREATDE